MQLSVPKKLRPAAGGQEDDAPQRTRTKFLGYKTGPQRGSVTSLSSVGGGGIQVDQLQAVDPDAAGILSAENGGFGVDMWGGSRRVFVDRLIGSLPRVASHTLRGLLRRVLLSAAQTPAGPGSGDSLAARRIGALISMGDYAAALDLLSVMPRQGRGPALARLEAELEFLTNDHVAACGRVGDEVTRQSKTAFWQQALVFCQILAGEASKAELALSLLRESEGIDPLFLLLADAMINGEAAKPDNWSAVRPLHLAMINASKAEVPIHAARKHPGLLRLVAVSPHFTAGDRLMAAELGAAIGVFRAGVLKRIYEKIDVPALGATEPKPGTQAAASDLGAPSPETEAALLRATNYRAALAAKIPTVKAEAISQAMQLAGRGQEFAGVARIFAPQLKTIVPSTDLLWFAPVALRTLAAAGEDEQARVWLRLVRTSAAISDESAKLYQDMAPVAYLLGSETIGAKDFPNLAGKENTQALLYLALLDGLNREPPLDHFEPLIMQADEMPPISDVALWMRLVRLNGMAPSSQPEVAVSQFKPAPRQGLAGVAVVSAEVLSAPTAGTHSGETRIGERLLIMTMALGRQPIYEANPIVVREILNGLRRIGLTKEATALAIEATVGSGL